MERWYVLRFATDVDELDQEALSAALTAAERAADEASGDLPGRWKIGPEIDSYVVSRRERESGRRGRPASQQAVRGYTYTVERGPEGPGGERGPVGCGTWDRFEDAKKVALQLMAEDPELGNARVVEHGPNGKTKTWHCVDPERNRWQSGGWR